MRKTTEGKKARPAARARLMAAIAVCAASALALEPPAAFAATDPIAAVDNLSTFIFGLIRSVGLILLACVIFSLFASAPPVVDAEAPVVTQVWSYVGELAFNMLVLTGMVKMADRVVREMMGL